MKIGCPTCGNKTKTLDLCACPLPQSVCENTKKLRPSEMSCEGKLCNCWIPNDKENKNE